MKKKLLIVLAVIVIAAGCMVPALSAADASVTLTYSGTAIGTLDSNKGKEGQIYVSWYSADGRMLTCDIYEVDAETDAVNLAEIHSGAVEFKVIWLDSYKPVSEEKTFSVSEVESGKIKIDDIEIG